MQASQKTEPKIRLGADRHERHVVRLVNQRPPLIARGLVALQHAWHDAGRRWNQSRELLGDGAVMLRRQQPPAFVRPAQEDVIVG